MTKTELDALHDELVEIFNRRLVLGNYNTDCEDIIEIVKTLVAIVHHLKKGAK